MEIKTNDSVKYVFPGLELLDSYFGERHVVSDEEMKRICGEIRAILLRHKRDAAMSDSICEREPMFDEAVNLISNEHVCTPAMLQEGLAVGYHRACNILAQMEDAGFVGAETNTGKKLVLLKKH